MKAMLPDDRQRIKVEVQKEVDAYFERRCVDMDAMILWILHKQFGFGKDRLRRYFDGYVTEIRSLQDHYGEDASYMMREGLKRIGVDIEKWEREL